MDQQSSKTIIRFCCKGLWLICLAYQQSTEICHLESMHAPLILPPSANIGRQLFPTTEREGARDPPPFCIEFPPRGRETEGFPFPPPFLFPPRQTMRPFRLKTYPEVPSPCLLFPPCQLASSTIFMGDEECLSESNCCSIEPTRIALHIFKFRKAEMEGGSAK